MKLSKLLFLLLLLPTLANANPVVRLYAGANAKWLGDATPVPEGVLAASASISDHISLVGDGAYDFKSGNVPYSGGVRITATDVNDQNFNIFLGLKYRAGEEVNEWTPDAGFGWRPNAGGLPNVLLGGDAGIGIQTKKPVVRVGLRWLFPVGK